MKDNRNPRKVVNIKWKGKSPRGSQEQNGNFKWRGI